jgi:hypothetical protein
VEHARRQLEVHGLVQPCRTLPKSTTVRVETRSIVVRARRGRSNDVPSIGAHPAAAERRRLPDAVVSSTSGMADAPAAPSAAIPRPNGKKQPSA